MAIIYLEEVTKQVQNKYLAVNVIAKRARALNDELLGAGFSKKQKPVSVATEELASGELTYQIVDPKTYESEVQPLFITETDDYDTLDRDEQIAELFGESPTEVPDVEPDIDVEAEVRFVDENIDVEDVEDAK